MALSDFEKTLQSEINQGSENFPAPLVQAVSSLLVLNSSYVGSRDLWWVDSPSATKGYNVYRAYDNPTGWTRLNGNIPWNGHFFRDATVLTQKTVTVKNPSDFVESGEFGKFGIKLPEIAYSSAVQGRPVVASSPDDVTVLADGKSFRPIMVVGLDQTVWMQMDNTVAPGGAVSATALFANNLPFGVGPFGAGAFGSTQALTVGSFGAGPFGAGAFGVGSIRSNTGSVTVADWSGVHNWQVTYNSLTNFVDIYTTLTRTYYTVVPVGDRGEVHAPGAPGTPVVNSQEVDRMDYMQKEMVRRNAWLFEEVGEPAYLLFRKTRGVTCGCKGTGVGQPRTGCPICFEVGIVGGYFGPYDVIFIDPDTAAVRELDEGGIKVTRDAKSYLGPTPIVQDGDLIVRRNGERMVINQVTYKSPRGIILQQEFNVHLLPRGDTRYLIPLNTGLPTIFNPIVQDNPLDGGKGNGEPIVDTRTDKDKVWENPDPQAARTITFGKIQT